MNTVIDQSIKKSKRKQNNIYILNDRLFEIIYPICIAFGLYAMFQPLMTNMQTVAQILILCGMILLGLIIGIVTAFSHPKELSAYKRQKDYEFIGLHDLSKEKDLTQCHDIMPRTDEISHIKTVLETIIFPQSEAKQLLCLIGESGCGKSTILSFFRNAYINDYEFFDFSGDYNHLDGKIEAVFGSSIDKTLSKLTYSKKVIIILDQFERYFFLAEEKKTRVKSILSKLGRKNSAIIVSMRQEYLASFLNEFDMNNVKTSDNQTHRKAIGVLNPLVSIIYDESHFSKFIERRKNLQTIEWKGMRIKNNFAVHMQPVNDNDSASLTDHMGVTLFYCENPNFQNVQSANDERKSVYMKSKCERLFGEEGTAFFERHKHKSLIEQQIIFHMAEYDQKSRLFTEEDLKLIFQMEDFDLIRRYFDIQLSASGNYYHASRILYLLSQVRLHQVTMKKEELAFGIYSSQFKLSGNEEFLRTLDRLEEYQLIHRSIENSKIEYEIAHDYIATAFITYCNSYMDRGVREGLDIYLSEFLDVKRKDDNSDKKISRDVSIQSDNYFKYITYSVVALTCIFYVIMRFIYNPWTTVWADFNPFGERIPLFVPFLTIVSMLYLGSMYDKVLKYYVGVGARLYRIMYIPLMMLALCSQLCYPHFLMLDGISLSIMGGNFAILLRKGHPEACQSELRSYGLKCALVGLVFACSHVMLYVFNADGFPNYLIFAEALMFSVLVLYSYLAHMSKEYLYARMMDASSRRI